MSSTESSSASSPTERYLGPEYQAALAVPPEPLLHTDPLRPPRLYLFVILVVCRVLRWAFRFRIEGLERVPAPPFIIASNHQAWYDTLFILAAFAEVPRMPMIYTMARRDTVFNQGWKRWLMPMVGVFPITPHQGQLDAGGVRSVYHVLSRGGAVLIFPEGRYSRGRDLRPLKSGVAHFALQAGVPICPIAISGLERLRPLARVGISIGIPIWPDPPRWWSFNRRVLRVVERVRRAILRAFAQADDTPRRGRLLARARSHLPRLPLPRRFRRSRPRSIE
jgi:1-acyl-sn-glycerol-3-phosphate acyltransferase